MFIRDEPHGTALALAGSDLNKAPPAPETQSDLRQSGSGSDIHAAATWKRGAQGEVGAARWSAGRGAVGARGDTVLHAL